MSTKPLSARQRAISSVAGPAASYIRAAKALEPNVTRLLPVVFNGTMISNGAGTALVVGVVPDAFSNSDEYRFYVRTIRGGMWPQNSVAARNFDHPHAVNFQIRENGVNYTWFEEPIPLSTLCNVGGTFPLQYNDMTFRTGWVVRPGGSIDCNFSHNTQVIAGFGATLTYYVQIVLFGDLIRVDGK